MKMLLVISKNDKVTNMIEEEGEKAYIRLCNLFIWKLNSNKDVKIEEVIKNGNREIQAETTIQGFLWRFRFTGEDGELENNLAFFNFKN